MITPYNAIESSNNGRIGIQRMHTSRYFYFDNVLTHIQLKSLTSSTLGGLSRQLKKIYLHFTTKQVKFLHLFFKLDMDNFSKKLVVGFDVSLILLFTSFQELMVASLTTNENYSLTWRALLQTTTPKFHLFYYLTV